MDVGQTDFNRQGLCILLLAFTSNMLTTGVVKSMGVLLPTLRDQFTTHTWVIGLVTSIYTGSNVLVGLSVRALESKFGTRKLLLVGSSAVGLGLVLVSRATSPIHIALSLGIISGPSTGIVCLLGQVLPARHFTKHYTLAFGTSHSGAAVAFVTFAPLAQLFLDTYGWRGTMLLIAAICCHSIPCAALIKDSKKDYESVSDREVDEQPGKGRTFSLQAFFVDLCKNTGVGIMLEFNFLITLCCRVGPSFAYTSWVVYFVPHLQAKGFSPEVAASLCTATALGYLLGAFLWVPLLDRGHVRSTVAYIISCLGMSLTFVVDHWLHNVASYAITSFIFGTALSASYTLCDVMTKEFFGVDRLVNVFAWLRAILIIPILLAGFVSGWIYDAVGSYDLAFVIIGCVPAVTLLPLIIGMVLTTTEKHL